MITGIGTDVVVIGRLQASFARFGEAFAKKILAPQEWEAFTCSKDKPRFLAKRFAAKEAVAKALGTGMKGLWFSEIAIGHDALGKPEVIALARCKGLMEQKHIKHAHLSISDEKDLAVAFVVLEN